MLWPIGLAVLGGVAAILVAAARQSASFHFQKSMRIKAPPARVFGLIADFRHWPAWAPQDKMDSTMSREFSGPASGAGAVSVWTARGPAGRGRMEITDANPPLSLDVTVDFEAPFRVRNRNRFELERSGEFTDVTWTMRGPRPFAAKLAGVFVNLDRKMGRHFDNGLESLKRLAETGLPDGHAPPGRTS